MLSIVTFFSCIDELIIDNHKDHHNHRVVDHKAVVVDKNIDCWVDHEDNYLVVVSLNNWDTYFLHWMHHILIDRVAFQIVVALDSEDKQDWVTVRAMYVGSDGMGH